nr:MAG TPA: hypothetical protein [Caudoviricetes sp.]
MPIRRRIFCSNRLTMPICSRGWNLIDRFWHMV